VSQVSLSWNASTGTAPITYSVFRGTTAGGENATAVATSLTSTSFTDTGLATGTTYYYKVSATNAAAATAQSGEASAKTLTPVLQINAGGGAVAPFVADTGFSGGNSSRVPRRSIHQESRAPPRKPCIRTFAGRHRSLTPSRA